MTSKEESKVEKAIAALDTMAEIWAIKAEVRKGIRAMLTLPDAENRIVAFVKQAHAEGLYEGRMSHYGEPTP